MQSYSYFVAFEIGMSAEEKRTADDCVEEEDEESCSCESEEKEDEVASEDDGNKQLVHMKWIFDDDRSIKAMINTLQSHIELFTELKDKGWELCYKVHNGYVNLHRTPPAPNAS